MVSLVILSIHQYLTMLPDLSALLKERSLLRLNQTFSENPDGFSAFFLYSHATINSGTISCSLYNGKDRNRESQ